LKPQIIHKSPTIVLLSQDHEREVNNDHSFRKTSIVLGIILGLSHFSNGESQYKKLTGNRYNKAMDIVFGIKTSFQTMYALPKMHYVTKPSVLLLFVFPFQPW